MQFGTTRILHVLIILVVFAFGLRLADFVGVVASFTQTAHAAAETAKAETPPNPAPKEDIKTAAAEDKKEAPAADTEKKEETKPASKGKKEKAEEVMDWKDSGDSDPDSTALRMEVFDELSKRRKALDTRDKDLSTREAMLEAAEKEIERKYQELTLLRKQIERLLEQQSEEERVRIQSLVKIYENMKPKDAARIFNTLDLDVLITVMSRMSEKKLSPILAEMSEDRAKTITIMLAEQKKLPSLPPVSQ